MSLWSGAPSAMAGAARLVGRNAVFSGALAVGLAVRVGITVIQPPVLAKNDSYAYIALALRPQPHVVRPSGYPLFLWLLRPFHSFTLVVTVQHLLTLAAVTGVYALLRRRTSLPGWAATLAVLPVIFGAWQLKMESAVMSEALFISLIVGAVVTMLWWRRPPAWGAAFAGLLLAGATSVRATGLPLVLVAVGYLVIRRVGWRPVVAFAIAAVVPLAGYGLWFQAWHGTVALTRSDGIFLYGRVMDFADCERMDPPASERRLCTETPPSARPKSDTYIWYPGTPLQSMDVDIFSADVNHLASSFAWRAIREQPLDFAATVTRDMGAFIAEPWIRMPPLAEELGYDSGANAAYVPHSDPIRDVREYEQGSLLVAAALGHDASSPPAPRAAGLLKAEGYATGLLLGVLLAAGAVGAAARGRIEIAFPWVFAVTLLLMPAATSVFDRRYALPAIPLALLAVALIWGRDECREKRLLPHVVIGKPVH
ncbi:hypothetical protein AB0M44_20920 [Streptosporangium subroseum]|uniref:hypothetical protein n=1 Tax=Streptosporangium subroseum TaxID=106412 RepID=UPI00343CEE38